MIKVFALASSIPKSCLRRLSVSQTKHERPELATIKKKQIQFQLNENTPVYIQGGTLDYILYYTTLGLVVVGVGMSMSSLYKLINKN